MNTIEQYNEWLRKCRDLFLNKHNDYGSAWTVLRPVSLVDQLYIKAHRIRTLQAKQTQRIGDSITGEFIGLVNYGIIGLIQTIHSPEMNESYDRLVVENWYDEAGEIAKATMLKKNHDYGEAWRDMSQESFADLIIMKLLRIRQILSNEGKTIVSEGIDANYVDIINYSLFALILIDEGIHQA